MFDSVRSSLAKVYLVTGPARSGKSEWAETLAIKSTKDVVYLATSVRDQTDVEWQQRIAQHIQRRPQHWQTQEVPHHLAGAMGAFGCDKCLLVDSLGTWLANWIDQDEAAWQQTQSALLQAINKSSADLIFVSEETGWGLVPAYPSGRIFRDRLGCLTRQIASKSDRVYLATAGYVLDLSHLGEAIPAIKNPLAD